MVTVQVITAARPEWIFPFTGLKPAQSGGWCAWSPNVVGTRSLTGDPVGSGPRSAGPGAAGCGVLANEPDAGPARSAVRGVALGGAPGHRQSRPAAGFGSGATTAEGPDRDCRRHPDPDPRPHAR